MLPFKNVLVALLFVFIGNCSRAQELFVFSEPASNMPAHTMALRLTHTFNPANTGIQMHGHPNY
jgi:hypothetical protein